MAHKGHVLSAMAFAQAREVLAEGDVEDPVQGVLDPPMAADGVCGPRGREGGGGDGVALLGGDVSFALADGLDANEGGELGKAGLAWEAALGSGGWRPSSPPRGLR